MGKTNLRISILTKRDGTCWRCKSYLIFRNENIPLSKIKTVGVRMVNEKILYCPQCHEYYVTQEMCRDLVRRYPGYFLNTSSYKVKKVNHSSNQSSAANIIVPQKVLSMDAVPSQSPHVEKSVNKISKEPAAEHAAPLDIKAPVYLSNAHSLDNNVCPLCRSTMRKELVNIPVIKNNGDFYRYYSGGALYCYRCGKAFISKEQASSILDKIYNSLEISDTVVLNNATAQRTKSGKGYMYRMTLSNNDAIYSERMDKRLKSTEAKVMELNEQSFLGELGYSAKLDSDSRKRILLEAVRLYGKRKVSDHLAFLISTRLAQKNGKEKYASAIRCWQDDLNFISGM